MVGWLVGRILLVAALSAGVWFVAAWVDGLARDEAERARLDPGVRWTLAGFARPLVLALGATVVAGTLGLEVAPIGYVVAAGVLALGLGLRPLFEASAAGAWLLSVRPFAVGDRVRIGEHEGVVVDVKWLATRLRTDEGDVVVVPSPRWLADVFRVRAPPPAPPEPPQDAP